MAAGLSNLANDLRFLGQHERARELDEESVAMERRLHGADHPNVAVSLSSLAGDFAALGEHERARELNEQALAMFQRLGERRSTPSA